MKAAQAVSLALQDPVIRALRLTSLLAALASPVSSGVSEIRRREVSHTRPLAMAKFAQVPKFATASTTIATVSSTKAALLVNPDLSESATQIEP